MGHKALPLGQQLSLDASDASQVGHDKTSMKTGAITAAPSSIPNIPSAASLINFDGVRQNPLYAGIDGAGLTIVVIDTGADLDHPAFGADRDGNGIADRILFQHDFHGPNDDDANDKYGHGTHVAGVLGSQDPAHLGIAPGVNLIILKIGSDTDGGAPTADMEEAWQWVVDNRDSYNIVAVNMSYGISNTYHDTEVLTELSDEIQTLTEAGIAAVIAAGNDYNGAPGVNYLSASPYAWSIASTLDDGSAFSPFSQRSSTMSDLAAPGSEIMSSTIGGAYGAMGGTSVATPLVSGLVALAQDLSQEITGGRTIPVMTLLHLMRSAGVTVTDGTSSVPRIDALKTLDAVVAYYQTSTSGNDSIWGWRDNDVLAGEDGQDAIFGHAGNDTLSGGPGSDLLQGGAGNDRLTGLSDKDTLYGDLGKDVFVFNARLNSTANVDHIADFKVIDDSFHLDNAVFRKVGSGTSSKPGELAVDMFTTGIKARDAEDRIIYDKARGKLYYDADGTGASKQIQFASLSKNLKMTCLDFSVI